MPRCTVFSVCYVNDDENQSRKRGEESTDVWGKGNAFVNGADRPQTGPQRIASRGNGAQEGGTGGAPSAPPTISLPKGGGAIRGMGEKFSANPVTGTGSMTVPIAVSPGRSGFGPQLSLSYDSGAGNGAFGYGWSLSVPTIARKTDKGLPKYEDSSSGIR